MAEIVNMPDVGEEAPDFEAKTQRGDTVRLSDFRGRKVALYFYPKDDTPGCTKQGCNLRDNYSQLLNAGIAVLGVSTDDVASHEQFADKYALPFPLAADPDHDIVNAYGVWGEKNLYGNKFMGTKRTTFLIDEQGKIVAVIKRPDTGNHAQEILKKFGIAGV
ncbi:MAG TPA: thioredoxin-dependent thiol peroxidase [Rhodothermales bacterium]|nr:thioredoxin-dependent thiol peroxidase [Rhodothermales bacterium]